MLKLITSSLLAHRGRLALTLVAVTLSVSFVSAGFVLADSLRTVFGDVSTSIYGDVDAEIRAGEGVFDQVESGERFAISALAVLDDIDGIDAVEPGLGGRNILFTVGPDGEAVRPSGPPTLTFSFTGSDASPFTIRSGAAPAEGQIAIDTAQAVALDVGVGDTVSVAGPDGIEPFVVSALVTFGNTESGVIPYFLLFDLDTMQRLLDGPGLIDSAVVSVTTGVDPAPVIESVEAVLPAGLLVADRAQLVAEQNSEFGQVIDVIQLALLGFAAITTFVATFVIANTFAVLVGQQTRQIGLLRSIGATGRQAGSVIVAEAALVGVVASVLGLAAGIGVAEGIKLLFESVTTGGFPEGPTRVLPRTVLVAGAVGIGVTALSALVPARRAARTSPLEALRSGGGSTVSVGSLPARLIALVGGPLRLLPGVTGELAVGSVSRNPRRVLNTAMSMIVGLGLITAITVLAASYRSTLAESVASDYDADLIATGSDGAVIPFEAFTELAALPEVQAATGFGSTEALVDGLVVEIDSFQSAIADDVVDFGLVSGSVLTAAEPSADAAVVMAASDFAASTGLTVGDRLPVEFSDGAVLDLTVIGVFDDSSVVGGDLLVDSSVVITHARNASAGLGVIRFADGIGQAAATDAVAEVLAEYPQATVVSVDEHLAAAEAQARQLLALANGLLGLTILVALTGIANTIALTVMERTSEIGLLRAVGMTRQQVRSMVRYEALIISTVGAGVGIAVGMTVAVGAGFFLPERVVDGITVPVSQLLVYLVAGVALGVVAAVGPAIRAGRLPVLDGLRPTG